MNRACALALALSGCVVAVDDSFCVGEPVDLIAVDLDNGDISVEPSDELCVQVELGGIGSNGVGHHVDDGVLYLDYHCAGPCGGDVRILAPRELAVDARLGAGDLSLRGRSGPVVAHVGAGALSAVDLESSWAELLVGTGDLTAEWLERPESVDAAVAAGAMALSLPSGGYRLDLDVDGGSLTVDGVFDDADAADTISAKTSAGDLTIVGTGPVEPTGAF